MAWISSIDSILFMTILMIGIAQIKGQEGVALSLRGVAIANDGYANVNDIGDEDHNALHCHTDKSGCCTNMMGQTRAGEWYYPNGTRVGTVGHNIYAGHTTYFFRSRGTQTVHLKRERHPSERGKFCCEVPNAYNSIQSICVNVVNIGRVVIYPFGASTAGMNFTLECSADITPNPLPANVSYPNFEWFYGPNNSSLPLGISVSNVSRSGNSYISNLHFSPLRQSHAGMYTCRLGGNARLATHTTLKVNAMIVIIQPVDLIVNSNDTAVFNFTVLGEPARKFTYQWKKNGSDFMEIPGKFEGLNTTRLVIKQARNKDEGAYWCVITNNAGDMVTTNEVFLIVVDLPAKPMITNISAASTSITISWVQDLSSDVIWYEFQYNFTIRTCKNYTGEGNKLVNSSVRSYSLENSTKTPIEEDSVYSILLIAMNLAGRSEAKLSEVSTHGNAPTGAPENLREMFIDDRTIVILWEPVECSHHNGEITGYSVTYYPQSEEMVKFKMTNTSHNNFTARGLLFNTTYVFEVQAFNRYGSGPPANATLQTSALQGIVIVYDGQSYRNNSIVNLDADGGILQCFTDKSGCCKFRLSGGEGEWIYPNGSTVAIRGKNIDFYRTRAEGVVNLVWNWNIMVPSGVFCCEIPPNQLQVACIGVYPVDEGFAMVINITVNINMNELVCTSTGGPATTTIWKINSKLITTYHQSQKIASKEDATFENILHVPTDTIANYNATYECIVMNSAGNDSMSLRLEAIQIAHGNMSIGDNGSLLCKSIIPVNAIEWLNSKGEVVISKTNTSELSLIFAPVNISINNQMYTCRVNKSASVNKTVVILVTVDDPLMVRIDHPSITPSIGQKVTVNCTATTVLGVIQLPILTLTHPNGTNLSSTEGRIVSFMFDPVHIEDAGEYTCTGIIHLENITSVIVQTKQNFTFKLPTPTIYIAHYEDSLSIGSSTALNCTVENYSVVDFDVSVNITWLRSGSVLSNESGRIFISSLHKLPSTFISMITVSPLSANDDNFTCSATAYVATLNSFIEMSTTVSKGVHLTVEAPDIMVQIESTVQGHNLTAGTNFSLICIIDGTAKLRSELNFQWMHFNGTDIEEIKTNSSRLHFSSLKLSEAGEYMCQVNIRSSLLRLDLNIMSMFPYPVRVFAPLPNVSIIPPSQAIFAGSSPNVTCVAVFDDTVDVPLVVAIAVFADGRDYPYYPVHMESYRRYTKTFTVMSIQSNREYLCVVSPPYSEVSPFITFMTDTMDIPHIYFNVSITASIAIEIVSSGNNIAGDKYNLTCTVVINGSSDVPSISWNGRVSTKIITQGNGTYLSILQFDPLQESHHDLYQCLVSVADITKEELFNLTVQVPTIYATISDSGVTPAVGQPYTLSCSVSGDERLNSSITYQWTQNNGTEVQFETKSKNIFFSSLSLSNSGNYSCRTIVLSSYLSEPIIAKSNFFSIQLQAPSPSSVEIISPPHTIFTDQMFHISCIVHLPSTVDILVTVNVVWNEAVENFTSPALMTETHNEYSSSATFVSDAQSKSISFRCAASVDSNSPFITESEITAADKSIFVVGRPSQPIRLNVSAVGSTSITITWSKRENDTVHGYELWYDYSVKECQSNTGMMSRIYISNATNSHTLEHLEEDSEFNVSLIAINPAGQSEPATLMATTKPSAPTGEPQDLNITSVDITNVTIWWNTVECSQRNGRIDGYRLIYYPTATSSDNESILINGSNTNTFTIVGLQPSSDYTLTLQAIGGNYSLFGNEQRRTVQTLMPQAIGFLFHGKVYGNNSVVSLMEIGEERKALLCITNKSGCCTIRDRPSAEWYFPNGSLVRIHGLGDSFYRNRDISIVRLNRRNNATSPSGIFQCHIPSYVHSYDIIHIGIYFDGEGIPNITSLDYSRSSISLICTSIGGPVTTVTWRKNNQLLNIDGFDYQQTQIIVDSEKAIYENILYSNDASDLVGVFMCIVQNAQGSDNKTISTNGIFLSIKVTSSDKSIAGEKYHMTCIVVINGSSDVPRISWNTSLSDEIVSNSNGTYLSVLHFDPLLFSDQDTYICQVKVADITDKQAYHLSVKVPTVLVNIEDTGVAHIAGKSYTLICNISSPEILNPMVMFEYQWFKDNGTLTQVETNSSTLSFHFLKLSDTGWYTCNVIIDYTHLSGPVSHASSRAFEIQFSVPQPIIVEVISDNPNPIISGTLLTLTCVVELSPAVDVPVAISTVWTGPDGSALAYTNPLIRLSFTHYISTAVLKDTELEDSGDYTCTVDIGDEITISARYLVIVANGMFQLRLKRTEDCQLWTATRATAYRNNIEDALEEAIKRLCRCSFSKDNFMKGSFGCDISPNLTTYRNTLIGTHNFNATQLIGFIQDWVNTGPKIKMDWYTVGVDSSCPVAIASLEEKECD